jgi:single-strand DNA-binding protein
MNSISIIGRLTRDVELKYTTAGKPIANMAIAVNDGYGENEHASFFDITVFGDSGERHAKYISKGALVGVTGSIRQERWEKNGNKFSKVVIIARNIDYLESKNSKQEKDSVEDEMPF